MNYEEFLKTITVLKDIKRTGWLYKEVPNPESVADHTFGVALLALTIELPKNISRERLIKMALIHDLAESEIGDVVWQQGKVKNTQKRTLKQEEEKQAFKKLFSCCPQEELLELAQEFMQEKTPTAKFLKELDKLEMVLQTTVYKTRTSSNLDEFWESAEEYITTPSVKKLFTTLRKKYTNS